MIRLAIDIGSFTTKIYMPGCGVVLAEATCVAVESNGEEYVCKAFGDRARALSGKAARLYCAPRRKWSLTALSVIAVSRPTWFLISSGLPA